MNTKCVGDGQHILLQKVIDQANQTSKRHDFHNDPNRQSGIFGIGALIMGYEYFPGTVCFRPDFFDLVSVGRLVKIKIIPVFVRKSAVGMRQIIGHSRADNDLDGFQGVVDQTS